MHVDSFVVQQQHWKTLGSHKVRDWQLRAVVDYHPFGNWYLQRNKAHILANSYETCCPGALRPESLVTTQLLEGIVIQRDCVLSFLPTVPQCPASPPCCCSLSDLPLTLFSVTGFLFQSLIHSLCPLTPWTSLTFYFVFDSPSSGVSLNHQPSLWNSWAWSAHSLLLPLLWGQQFCELFQPYIKVISLTEIHRASISPCWSLFWKSSKDF